MAVSSAGKTGAGVARRVRWSGLALVALAGLCGCDKPTSELEAFKQVYLAPTIQVERKPEQTVLPGVDAATGQVARISTGARSDRYNLAKEVQIKPVAPSPGTVSTPSGLRTIAEDYTDKADIYWKLNWLRKELLGGSAPSTLDAIIARLRRQLEGGKRDGNYDVGAQAIDYLEEGWEHYTADRDLRAAGVNPIAVPWIGGRDGVTRFIARNGLGFGGEATSGGTRSRSNLLDDSEDIPIRMRRYRPSGATLTATQQRVVDIVIQYAEKYQASPEQMMRGAWKKFIERTNKLRDQLGLTNRPSNRDGNMSDVNAAITESVGSNLDKVFSAPALPSENSIPEGGIATPPDIIRP